MGDSGPERTYVFVDGGYLRKISEEFAGGAELSPLRIAHTASAHVGLVNHARVFRVNYYDASPDEPTAAMKMYWERVEQLPDVEVRMGVLRGRKPDRPRQKGVDTLLTIDMLVGAYERLYDLAILVAGDADFVPIVHEVRRHGARVMVAAHRTAKGAVLAAELRDAGDRFWDLAEVGNWHNHRIDPN